MSADTFSKNQLKYAGLHPCQIYQYSFDKQKLIIKILYMTYPRDYKHVCNHLKRFPLKAHSILHISYFPWVHAQIHKLQLEKMGKMLVFNTWKPQGSLKKRIIVGAPQLITSEVPTHVTRWTWFSKLRSGIVRLRKACCAKDKLYF